MSGEGDRVSRPSSLLLETARPEKEPLKFDVQLVGAPPEVEQLVNNIKDVAENFLYHWKTFPIVLPPSRFSGPGNNLSDIIVAPACDELDIAALDASPEPRPLSAKQLHSIREKGEFEVPSRHFPGQTQVWRVAGWLQRGRARARDDLYCDLARAAAIIVVVARDRLLKDKPLSVIAGFKALLRGLRNILDLLIGMPQLEARDLDKRIRDERSRYLVAELICKPEYKSNISALASYVKSNMSRGREKGHSRCPSVPYVYTTPQGIEIDLRLYRRETLRRLSPQLQSILERESRGWFLHYKERLAAELARQKCPVEDMTQEIACSGMRQYVKRVCARVLAADELAELRHLLAAQLQATAIMLHAEESVRKKLEATIATAEARTRAAHPILSRSDTWRKERVNAAGNRVLNALQCAAGEDAAAAMLKAGLSQHRYFLLRDLTFLRDREPLLIKELRKAKTPVREFHWSTRIYRHGRFEKVSYTTDTRHVGYRLVNWAYRSWCWCWWLVLVLGLAVPCCSPLSLRTLLAAQPFAPPYALAQVNNRLFPGHSGEVPTMWSRLVALWRLVSKERSRFDTQPDTAELSKDVNTTLLMPLSLLHACLSLSKRAVFPRTSEDDIGQDSLLGSGVSRCLHLVWWQCIVGAGCTLALLLLWPIVSLTVSATALLLCLGAPVIAPVAAAAAALPAVLVYDGTRTDCRWFPLLHAALYEAAALGALQPLCAALAGLVLCPLASLLLAIVTSCWWCVRCAWERAAAALVLSRLARVPTQDSVLCRRLPARPHRAYLQINAAQAVCALCARAELEALTVWTNSMCQRIEAPLNDYRHLAVACFKPFSLSLAKTGPYKQLEKECAELAATLREKVAERKRELSLGLSDAARAKVRMTRDDLQLTIEVGSSEISTILNCMSDEWWSGRGVEPQQSLALCADLLTEIFHPDILSALEESAIRVPLESGTGARRWHCLTRAHTPNPHSSIDAYWSMAPRVSAPALPADAFSPRPAPHPPLPPPHALPLLLYNRDADSPIPLDDEVCVEILRSMEDAPDAETTGCVERSGGESSEESSSDDGAERPPAAAPGGEGGGERGGEAGVARQCRWTLTGRGARLRPDLASPEDCSLDLDRLPACV